MKQSGILLSIKPRFAEQILTGDKTVELRRVRPTLEPDELVLLYATSPISAIIGWFTVHAVVTQQLDQLWQTHGPQSSVSHDEFRFYFQGLDEGVAILVEKAFSLENPEVIDLEKLRQFYPGFHPPQGFRYIQRFDDRGDKLLSNLHQEPKSLESSHEPPQNTDRETAMG